MKGWKKEWGPIPTKMRIVNHKERLKGKPFTIFIPQCYMCNDIMGLKSPQGNCTMMDEHDRHWCDSCVEVEA